MAHPFEKKTVVGVDIDAYIEGTEDPCVRACANAALEEVQTASALEPVSSFGELTVIDEERAEAGLAFLELLNR